MLTSLNKLSDGKQTIEREISKKVLEQRIGYLSNQQTFIIAEKDHWKNVLFKDWYSKQQVAEPNLDLKKAKKTFDLQFG